MKQQTKNLLKSLVLLSAAIGFTSCDVEKTEDGEVPSVKVEVDGEAKLPKYDVDAPHVEVEKKKVEVEVPSIKVTPADEDTHDQ